MTQDEIRSTIDGTVSCIRKSYEHNHEPYFIMPISGERYNSVVTALYTNALGKERILGVYMPNLKRKIKIEDMQSALGVNIVTIPITLPMADIINEMDDKGIPYNEEIFHYLEMQLRSDVSEFIARSYNTEYLSDTELKPSWKTLYVQYYEDEELLEIGRELGLPDTVLCI